MLEIKVFCMVLAVKDLIAKLVKAGLDGFPLPWIQTPHRVVEKRDEYGHSGDGNFLPKVNESGCRKNKFFCVRAQKAKTL